MNVTLESIVSQTDNVLSAHLEDEVVLMSIETGDYYDLDAIGSEIWETLKTPQNVADISRSMSEKFGADLEQCQQDIIAFLADLYDLNAVTVQ